MHPAQTELTDVTVQLTESHAHEYIRSDVFFRNDGWVWVEEVSRFFPPSSISHIEPNNTDLKTNQDQ